MPGGKKFRSGRKPRIIAAMKTMNKRGWTSLPTENKNYVQVVEVDADTKPVATMSGVIINPLTDREKKFVQSYLDNGGDAKAAAAESLPGEPSRAAESIIGKQNVQRAIVTALTMEGIDQTLIARKLKEGLEAMKETFVPTPDGSAIKVESADYATRHRYLDTAIKIRGEYAPKEVKMEGKTIHEIMPVPLDRYRLKRVEPVVPFEDGEIVEEKPAG